MLKPSGISVREARIRGHYNVDSTAVGSTSLFGFCIRVATEKIAHCGAIILKPIKQDADIRTNTKVLDSPLQVFPGLFWP